MPTVALVDFNRSCSRYAYSSEVKAIRYVVEDTVVIIEVVAKGVKVKASHGLPSIKDYVNDYMLFILAACISASTKLCGLLTFSGVHKNKGSVVGSSKPRFPLSTLKSSLLVASTKKINVVIQFHSLSLIKLYPIIPNAEGIVKYFLTFFLLLSPILRRDANVEWCHPAGSAQSLWRCSP